MTVYVQSICKFGQGAPCCKFLSLKGSGFHCLKMDMTPAKKIQFEHEHAEAKHKAQGDNCPGKINLNDDADELR